MGRGKKGKKKEKRIQKPIINSILSSKYMKGGLEREGGKGGKTEKGEKGG